MKRSTGLLRIDGNSAPRTPTQRIQVALRVLPVNQAIITGR
jgi:hypothetical protein